MTLSTRAAALLAGASVALLSVPTWAVASRRASDVETRQMATDTGFRPACFFAQVSTVDRTWAVGTEVGLGSCQRRIGNGYVVIHHWGTSAGAMRWRDVLQASEGHDTMCEDYGIPLRVARDLGPVLPICVRAAHAART